MIWAASALFVLGASPPAFVCLNPQCSGRRGRVVAPSRPTRPPLLKPSRSGVGWATRAGPPPAYSGGNGARFQCRPPRLPCPPFGFPRRRRLRRPLSPWGVNLRRRRLRRLTGPLAPASVLRVAVPGVRLVYRCKLTKWQQFTNVIHKCKAGAGSGAPVKYYGGLPPSPFIGPGVPCAGPLGSPARPSGSLAAGGFGGRSRRGGPPLRSGLAAGGFGGTSVGLFQG